MGYAKTRSEVLKTVEATVQKKESRLSEGIKDGGVDFVKDGLS